MFHALMVTHFILGNVDKNIKGRCFVVRNDHKHRHELTTANVSKQASAALTSPARVLLPPARDAQLASFHSLHSETQVASSRACPPENSW